MDQTKRTQKLVSLLHARGYLDVATVARELGVSIATARRDLRHLAEQHLAVRTHGGILGPSVRSTTHEAAMAAKRALMVPEKRAIGRLAASLTRTGESLIIDSGSTTFEVARFLGGKKPLTILCNDVDILSYLASIPGLTLIDPGGIVRPGFVTLLGADTVRFITDLRVDVAFLGADGFDPNGGVTISNQEEVAIKRAMIEAAKRVVLVADHRKFGEVAFAKVCELHAMQLIVTDMGLTQEQAEQIQGLGIELLIANKEGLEAAASPVSSPTNELSA